MATELKLITDVATLDKRITKLGTTVANMAIEIRLLSLSAAQHFKNHGDVIFLNRISNAIPAHMRNSYLAWAERFAGVSMQDVQVFAKDAEGNVLKAEDGKPVVEKVIQELRKDSSKKVDMEAASKVKPDEFRPPRPYNYNPFNLVAQIGSAMATADKHRTAEFKDSIAKRAKNAGAEVPDVEKADVIPAGLLDALRKAYHEYSYLDPKAKANADANASGNAPVATKGTEIVPAAEGRKSAPGRRAA